MRTIAWPLILVLGLAGGCGVPSASRSANDVRPGERPARTGDDAREAQLPDDGSKGESAFPGGGKTPAGNPFDGASFYLNPEFIANVNASAARADDALAAAVRKVAGYPTAIWLDRIAALHGGTGRRGITGHLDEALAQQARAGGKPVLVAFVVYNLPGRDCAAFASNGELPGTDAGLARYKSEYIDAIVSQLQAKPEYSKLRIVAVLEPDALPNGITNLGIYEKCRTAFPLYKEGVAYAIRRLATVRNVSLYLDIAHSGWLGWDHTDKAVALYKEVLENSGAESRVRGFATNVANYSTLRENFDPFSDVNAHRAIVEGFYEWNRVLDELTFVAKLRTQFGDKGFLVDTGRNGWPERGAQQPRDARTHRGNWCNPQGAGIGERPQASPADGIDAFFWVKPPGESDGTSDVTATTPDAEGKSFDKMCGTGAVERPYAPGKQIPTDALGGAPAAGKWFHEQFLMLVLNATPSL